eukprot:scaffold98067_cov46-Prasinocladus_malaysianus.AAC.1
MSEDELASVLGMEPFGHRRKLKLKLQSLTPNRARAQPAMKGDASSGEHPAKKSKPCKSTETSHVQAAAESLPPKPSVEHEVVGLGEVNSTQNVKSCCKWPGGKNYGMGKGTGWGCQTIQSSKNSKM